MRTTLGFRFALVLHSDVFKSRDFSARREGIDKPRIRTEWTARFELEET